MKIMHSAQCIVHNFRVLVIFALCTMHCALCTETKASDKQGRLMLGTGLMYPNTWEATISYERETSYHNAWEFFANGALKWSECESCGHVCPDTFWRGYRTWGVGAAYKPCVSRGRNHHGNLRIGGSLGSDLDEFLGYLHLGYEHDYQLKGGWQLFWQVKTDMIINGDDLFRVGFSLGVKLPI